MARYQRFLTYPDRYSLAAIIGMVLRDVEPCDTPRVTPLRPGADFVPLAEIHNGNGYDEFITFIEVAHKEKLAEKFNVDPSTMHRWIRVYNKEIANAVLRHADPPAMPRKRYGWLPVVVLYAVTAFIACLLLHFR